MTNRKADVATAPLPSVPTTAAIAAAAAVVTMRSARNVYAEEVEGRCIYSTQRAA